MANEGLVRDSLLKMVHNPGGDDCILGGGQPNLYLPNLLCKVGFHGVAWVQKETNEKTEIPKRGI